MVVAPTVGVLVGNELENSLFQQIVVILFSYLLFGDLVPYSTQAVQLKTKWVS